MKQFCTEELIKAYEKSQLPGIIFQNCIPSPLPITYKDSLCEVPDYPFCTLGILTAAGEWGSKQGVAFVIDYNYLLTCASNCYSHQHGEYPNITFTINSNRQSGYDTHKIKKVFIPQKYKTLPQNERDNYSYALLYIEGVPNMKDKHGIIGIIFRYPQWHIKGPQTTFECEVKENELLLKSQHLINQQLPLIMSGTPIFIRGGQVNQKMSIGLIIQKQGQQRKTLIFSQVVKQQLCQWMQENKKIHFFRLNYYLSGRITFQDESCLKDKPVRPEVNIQMNKWHLRSPTTFFQHLPFSSVKKLTLYEHKQLQNLEFLQLQKFRGLKQLSLCQNRLGPSGGKFIANISFEDLQKLDLSYNSIGNQGCRYFSPAKWPKLSCLRLTYCQIGSEGTLFLSQQKWRNLAYLFLDNNQFDSEISSVLERANTPRIIYFNLNKNSLGNEDLKFLKFPSWKWLTQLYLSGCKVENKGCKYIKQANLALIRLDLRQCGISSTGVKWLCKANLTKIQSLDLQCNKIGKVGCLFLMKANMPKICKLSFSGDNTTCYEFKRFFKSDWAKNVDYTNMDFLIFKFQMYWRQFFMQG